jgi:peptidoglycan hydrolase CwlO-like protein
MIGLNLATITNSIQTISSSGSDINWTIILSVLIVSLVSMMSVIKIFGQPNSDESKDKEEDEINDAFKGIKKEQEDNLKESNKKQDDIKNIINELRIDIQIAKNELTSNSKSIDELKKDYRALTSRLDELLLLILESYNT